MSHYPYHENPDDPTSEMHLSVSARLSCQPGNRLYVALQIHQIMLTLLGVANREQVGESRKRLFAKAVERHFWRELGHGASPDFPGEIPAFLCDAVTVVQPMTLAHLVEKLANLTRPKPSRKSFAAQNISLLQSTLNLTHCETKMLMWSYCHEQAEPSPIPDMAFESIADRNIFVGWMLNEDVDVVSDYFTKRRLASLRLLETKTISSKDRAQEAGTLHGILAGSDHFINLIELPHGSPQAILHHLMAPELDDWLDGSKLPAEALDCLAPPFARLYEQGRAHATLCTASLQLMVDWLTGITLTETNLLPLEGKLKFETARDAIKWSALRCCHQNRELDKVNVLQALADAARQDAAHSPWEVAIA